MTQKTGRLLSFDAKTMTKTQIVVLIARIDASAVAMMTQMKSMGPFYKLKVGIPALRSYDAARERLRMELDTRN